MIYIIFVDKIVVIFTSVDDGCGEGGGGEEKLDLESWWR